MGPVRLQWSVLWLVVGVLLAGGTAGAAHSNVTAAALAHFDKGRKAEERGRYDEAIVEFSAGYKLKGDPIFLFHIAEAHRLARNPEEALQAYRRYLALMPEEGHRTEVEARLAEMERLLAETRAPQPPPQPTAAPVSRAFDAGGGTIGTSAAEVGAHEDRRSGRTISREPLVLPRTAGAALRIDF
jgi:tetratricopeptide (TPR) repeat protein